MDKVDPKRIKDILIVRIGKIGDIIATSFVFEVIKKNNPGINITLITKETNKNVLCYNPSIDRIHYVGSGIRRYIQLLSLRKKKYDLILDFNDNSSQTTKLIFSCFNGSVKCGYDFPLYEKYLDVKIPQLPKNDSHIIDRMKRFLIEAGFTNYEELVKPFMYLGEQEEKEALISLLPFKGKKIIALNISAGAETRFWNTKNWIELIKRISGLGSEYSFVLLSVKENEKEAFEILKNYPDGNAIKPFYSSFQHFACYIKNAYMLITPDTSAVHAAASFGVPVIALYPDSIWNFSSWRPYKTPNRAIMSGTESINSILIEEVFNNFVELNNEIVNNGK